MSSLSILITVLNDEEECNATIRSIRETAGYEPEIVVVDDASNTPLKVGDKKVVLLRNETRAGVGPSRHIAALCSSSDTLLLTDSHMRFTPGWYEEACKRIEGNRTTMYCAQCLGLSAKNMHVSKPEARYNGATIQFYGQGDRNGFQIMEGKWLPDRPGEDNYELPCVMGAAYFIPADLFFHVGGLRMLKDWGTDEPFLSLKVWLAGGEVRMMKTVQIGHKFRTSAPYSTEQSSLVYNKMMMALTCLPQDKAHKLISLFRNTQDVARARNRINQDAGQIQAERVYYSKIFTRDFDWYLTKFGIQFP